MPVDREPPPARVRDEGMQLRQLKELNKNERLAIEKAWVDIKERQRELWTHEKKIANERARLETLRFQLAIQADEQVAMVARRVNRSALWCTAHFWWHEVGMMTDC